MFNAADSSCAEAGSIHDQRIELHFAFAIQKTAPAGVKSFVIFHDDDSFFNRVEGGPVFFEHTPSRRYRVAHTVQMSFDKFVGNGPRAAVYDQNWMIFQAGRP